MRITSRILPGLLLLTCVASLAAAQGTAGRGATDWSKLKIRQLRNAASARGIQTATFLTKDDFVNALTEYAKTDLVTDRESTPGDGRDVSGCGPRVGCRCPVC